MGSLYAYQDRQPRVAASALLFDSAEVTGDVTIGDESIIGAGVKIIGDSHGPVRIGKRVVAPAGTLIYIPANAPHNLVATPDEDVIFIAIKDLSQGIIGKAVDGTMEGPAYLKGYEPKQRPAARRP